MADRGRKKSKPLTLGAVRKPGDGHLTPRAGARDALLARGTSGEVPSWGQDVSRASSTPARSLLRAPPPLDRSSPRGATSPTCAVDAGLGR